MTFEDFLDMMSVFSDNAPKSVKVEYAFRIYDFDNDDTLSNSDLTEVCCFTSTNAHIDWLTIIKHELCLT